jgi:hypothetical protein
MSRQKTMSIQIRKCHTRQSPSFLAQVTGTLPYGRKVDVIIEQESWIQVICKESGISGWVHTSALTPKKIIMIAGEKDVPISAQSEEYALAGKGFNKDVENRFRSQNPDLNFTWIDRMERFIVSARHKDTFLAAGQLGHPKEGI